MSNNKLFDVIIIGGGHAGLSAALTLCRQLHTVLILDDQKPRNAWALPTHVVSGWEGREAEELRVTSRRELAATDLVTFVDGQARLVTKSHEEFEVTDEEGRHWTGRTLLLALGKQNIFPDIPGYEENFPAKIFHCMFTFGYENRGSEHAGLLADGALSSPFHAAMVVGDTKKFAERVTVFTNGKTALKEEMVDYIKHSNVTFDDRRLLRIQRSDSGLELELEGGPIQQVDFLVHQPSTKVNTPLVEQLGLELDERGDIKNIPPFFQTNVPGVFVAGDCGSPFKIIPMAMFMGANAGAGIARSLAAENLKKELASTVKVDRINGVTVN